MHYKSLGRELNPRSLNSFNSNGTKTCPATDDIGDSCCICTDPFEIFWYEEREEWHFRDAIRVDNRIYHPICFEDARDDSVPPTPVPKTSSETAPGLSKQLFYIKNEPTETPSPSHTDSNVSVDNTQTTNLSASFDNTANDVDSANEASMHFEVTATHTNTNRILNSASSSTSSKGEPNTP